MNRQFARRFQAALFALLVISVFIPLTARAQSNPVDITARFRSAGVDVDALLVFQISGVVIIRGVTADRFKAEEAGTTARRLGYTRIANLIEITEPSDDASIVQIAEGRLSQDRSLDGCKFHINSLRGVLHIEGSVGRELQKDVVIEHLRKIRGVTAVHSDLTVL
jgi:osmotically-inducible protein OsmY